MLRNLSLCVLVLCSAIYYAQDIRSKKGELKGIEKEITSLEAELREKNRSEKKSLELIENYNKQNYLLNKLISTIKSEEIEKDKQIGNTETEISSVERKIQKLRASYTKYIVYLYKHGGGSIFNTLFGSENFGQVLVRYKYLQKISEQRTKELSELKSSKLILSGLHTSLLKEKNEKQQLSAQKQKEEKQLQQKLNERKVLLSVLREDKTELKKEIELKRRAQSEIKNIISRLVAEDENRRAREKAQLEAKRKKKMQEQSEKMLASRSKSAKMKNEASSKNRKSGISSTVEKDQYVKNRELFEESKSYEPVAGSSFSALKGQLGWPVSRGGIIRRFGENRNSKLNTVTINYGIDITVNGDLNVKSVADGIVSSVTWVPGYGSVMIVTHSGGYRTVYGHLEQIYASKGNKISAGSIIGKVGESLEGNVLHFEVWNERQTLNPEHWLR